MLHTRMRLLIAAVALLAMLATTMLAGPALHSALADSNRPQEYLALGNSVAFGFNPSPSIDRSNADNFIGYPTPVAAALKEALTNASCPGETSSHFISLAGSDHGCGAYRANFPLHVAYSTSQLDYADGFLQSHPQTLVVSIDIGANDLFVLEEGCSFNVNCILAGLPGMLATLSANLNTIYGHIRNRSLPTGSARSPPPPPPLAATRVRRDYASWWCPLLLPVTSTRRLPGATCWRKPS